MLVVVLFVLQECFPYLARRLLNDDDPNVQQALKDVLYGGKQRLDVDRYVTCVHCRMHTSQNTFRKCAPPHAHHTHVVPRNRPKGAQIMCTCHSMSCTYIYFLLFWVCS